MRLSAVDHQIMPFAALAGGILEILLPYFPILPRPPVSRPALPSRKVHSGPREFAGAARAQERVKTLLRFLDH
jgi:hypothetical protein